jgi:DNA-binding ferritin-like protein
METTVDLKDIIEENKDKGYEPPRTIEEQMHHAFMQEADRLYLEAKEDIHSMIDRHFEKLKEDTHEIIERNVDEAFNHPLIKYLPLWVAAIGFLIALFIMLTIQNL